MKTKVVEIKDVEIVDIVGSYSGKENKYRSVMAKFSTGDAALLRCGERPGLYLCAACADKMVRKKDVILSWPRDRQFKMLGLNTDIHFRFHYRPFFIKGAKKRRIDRSGLYEASKEWKKDEKFFDLMMRWIKYGSSKTVDSTEEEQKARAEFTDTNTGGSYGRHECVASED